MRDVNVNCIKKNIDKKFVFDYWNAFIRYTKCGTSLEQEGRSQEYINSGPQTQIGLELLTDK